MIATALHNVQERIEAAKARVGRRDFVTLVAVTKNHPVEAVQEVARLGVRTVGENRVQEAKEKMGKIINEKFPEIRKKISETKIQRETHRHSRWFFLCGPRAYLTSGASTRLRPVHLHPTSCYP